MAIEIIETRVMKGPNIWSVEFSHLIIMKIRSHAEVRNLKNLILDLEELLPHGRFETDSVPDVIPQTVLKVIQEILYESGSEPEFADVEFIAENGTYNLIFDYEEEQSAVKAAKLAVSIVNDLITGKDVSDIKRDLKEIASLKNYNSIGPSTSAIVNAALERNIPVKKINGHMYGLGFGKKMKRVAGSLAETTSIIGVDVAGNKEETKDLLEKAFLPVPKGIIATSEEDLSAAVAYLGFPLVAKPLNGNHGKGITGNITHHYELEDAFHRAQKISKAVIVEKHIVGDDYRFLVIDYKLVAVAKRTPAMVVGDGVHTIQELIDIANTDPRRGVGHDNVLTEITVDAITLDILKSKKLTLNSILPKHENLVLKDTANISTGGTATDVTDLIHPVNKRIAERAAEVVGLDLCGIDIIAKDLTIPLTDQNGAILEVNAAPGLRMHISPYEGTPRDVGKAIIDMMFPGDETGRIPIVAITGTNGKTTTSRLMAHMAKAAGHYVGFTTTDGIYLNGELIAKGDFTGPKSTEVILAEKSVDFAVLECARGGILRSGLAFDQCDIGIVTNVAEDHLGIKDIYTINDMARVKSVVPKSVKEDGTAILNADDDLVYAMKDELSSYYALFSLDAANPRIKEHVAKGGIAAVLQKDKIVILPGKKKAIDLGKASDIPLTLGGKADFMIANILPVAIAGYVSGFPEEVIAESFKTFFPSAEQTPGRMNVFNFGNFEVIVDYAHNSHSFKGLAGYLNKVTDKHKIGIVTGVGDRRTEDIVNAGKLAAEMYDEIIIRVDTDTRGRSADEIVELVTSGVHSVADKKIKVIPDETEAIKYAVRHAKPASLIVINTEKVEKTLNVVNELKNKVKK